MSKYLQKVLEERNMSQAELGRRIGVKRNTINHYVKGNKKNMKLDTMIKYSLALGIPIEDFVKGLVEDE